jgi:hypothetical protein
MSDGVATEIESLKTMDRRQLIAKWESELKEPAPAHLRKETLLPILAYKLQEKIYGGLSPELKRQLRKLAEGFKSNPAKTTSQLVGSPRIKPGTRLVRDWQGQTHTVTVCEGGFEYRGERYRSLSQIARLITGTRWSGPLFFGLKPSLHRLKSQ